MYKLKEVPQDIESVLEIPEFAEIGFFQDENPFEKFNQLDEFKKMELRLIIEYLNQNRWCQSHTAKALGINPKKLYTMLQNWQIKCIFWRKHIPRNGK